MKYRWGFFPKRRTAAFVRRPSSRMRSRCASKSFAEVETGNLKPRRSLATRMKSRILTVERSLSEAPSHTELSNGPVWIFLCSSRKRTKVAATASFKLFRLGNVLRTLSDSTFSKKRCSLGVRTSNLFTNTKRGLLCSPAQSYSRSVGDTPTASSKPYSRPMRPR